MYVTQVFTTNESNNVNPSNPKLDQLERLRQDLEKKKAATTETAQIQMIDVAIQKVNDAREEAQLNKKTTQAQTKLGQYKHVQSAKSAKTEQIQKAEETKQVQGVISDKEAEQIVKIKAVESAAIEPGQKFASMSGKEPSVVSHMKTNIKGLWDLVELKEQA